MQDFTFMNWYYSDTYDKYKHLIAKNFKNRNNPETLLTLSEGHTLETYPAHGKTLDQG